MREKLDFMKLISRFKLDGQMEDIIDIFEESGLGKKS